MRIQLVWAAWLGMAAAQDAPIRVDVKVVNVLCTVYDARGALVNDLRRDEFEVRENGAAQTIQYFARETELPLNVSLLVDVSGSVSRFVQSEKATAAAFFQHVLRPQDRAMLTGFSSTVVTWQEFTGSAGQLRGALEKMHAMPFHGLPKDGGPMPTTLLYDAVSSTAADKLKEIEGRKAMVIISDGIDLGSRTSAEMAVRRAQSANAVIYTICYPNPQEPGCSYLKNLSEPTGGRMFDLGSKMPLREIFRVIEDELRSQYSLGYVPSHTAREASFRKVQVSVRRSGMKVRARKGYHAEE